MRKSVSLLSAVLITGCNALAADECANDHVPAYTGDKFIPITISDLWLPEQQVEILKAIDFWELVFEGTDIELLVTIGDCDMEYGCIRPVEYDPFLKQVDDPEDDSFVIGLYMDGFISILLDFENLEGVAVHELGHFFGLDHEDVGAMTPNVGDMSYALGPKSVTALKGYGLLK